MIVFLTGAPGSGKSYAAVKEIVEALEAGKVVATNIPLRDGWATEIAKGNIFRRVIPGAVQKAAERFERLTFISEDLDELLRVVVRGSDEERAVMVLDELHRRLNSRTWDADMPELVDADYNDPRAIREASRRYRERIVSWFSGHRHYGWKVVICVQDAEMIDKQVRVLGEYYVVCRDAKRFRIVNVPLFPIHVFLQLWCWNDRKRTIVRRRAYLLRKRFARLYATHALAEVDAPSNAIWMPREAEPAGPGDAAGGVLRPAEPTPPVPQLLPDVSPLPDFSRPQECSE